VTYRHGMVSPMQAVRVIAEAEVPALPICALMALSLSVFACVERHSKYRRHRI